MDFIVELDANYSIHRDKKDPNFIFSTVKLLHDLRHLTDNFAGYKSGGSTIKIPSEKQRKIELELLKQTPFHPEINKKSSQLEKLHYAKYFEKRHQEIKDQTSLQEPDIVSINVQNGDYYEN